MAEEVKAEPQEPTHAEPKEPEAKPQEQEKDWKAEYEKLLDTSRKWEKRSKENASKAKAYDEMKAAQMSDAERAEKAEAELAKYKHDEERRQWVSSVSKETGVPDAVLLHADAENEEDLKQYAESIKEYFKVPAAPVVPSAGINPQTPNTETANDWLRESLKRR